MLFPEYGYVHGTRLWMIVLAVAVSLLMCGIAYSAYNFYRQYGSLSEDVSVEGKIVQYRDKEVLEMATKYSEKESAFETLRKDVPTVSVNTPTIPEMTQTDLATTSEQETKEALADEPVTEYTTLDVQ